MNKSPRQWVAYLGMSYYTFLSMIRNSASLFFGFAFPIIFISVFGLIGNSTPTVNIGVPDQYQNTPVAAALQKVAVAKITNGTTDDLNKKLVQGKLDAVLTVVPESNKPGYKVTVVTSNGNPTGGSVASSLVRGVVDQLNLSLSGVKNTLISLDQQEVGGRPFRYIDFILPGQIGLSVISTAIFGTVFGFLALRRLLVLKRMFATPVKPLTILLAQGTSRLVMALMQTIIIVLLGVFAFHFYLPHGWETLLEILLICTLGLVSFMGIGLFLAGLAKDENTAPQLVNIVTLPQFLLSGVFFSSEALPIWVQPIANNLPLSYFNQAIRKITTENGNFVDTWPYLLGLLGWGILAYLIASRTFRWEN